MNYKSKLTILVLSLITTFNLYSTEIVNCNKKEIEKDYNYFCLINENGKYYIKETISLLTEPENFEESISSKNDSLSFNANIKNREPLSKQIYRVQEVKNITDDIFKHDFKMENQNGLITIIEENNNLYTLRSGYIQDNGHYLEIRNNKLESLKKENIKNVKKVSSYSEIYALTYDNEIWYKKEEIWIKIDITDVYDFLYLEDGRIYILTKQGLYQNDLNLKNKNFVVMELDIDETLYLNKIEYEKYKNSIRKLLFNKDSELEVNYKNSYNKTLEPLFKNKNYEDYDVYIDSKKIKIIDKKFRGYNRDSIHYRNAVHSDKLDYYYYINAIEYIKDISKYSAKYDTWFATVLQNTIKTKFNGNVTFNNKEKVILKNAYDNPVSNYEYLSDIINIKSKNGVYFSLRDNGMLSIFNTIKNEEYKIYNVNNIFLENDEIYILIDKDFESEMSTMKTFPIINHSKEINYEKFIFKFTSFEDLSYEFKTKYLSAQN
jgi:hypothetical protein